MINWRAIFYLNLIKLHFFSLQNVKNKVNLLNIVIWDISSIKLSIFAPKLKNFFQNSKIFCEKLGFWAIGLTFIAGKASKKRAWANICMNRTREMYHSPGFFCPKSTQVHSSKISWKWFLAFWNEFWHFGNYFWHFEVASLHFGFTFSGETWGFWLENVWKQQFCMNLWCVLSQFTVF